MNLRNAALVSGFILLAFLSNSFSRDVAVALENGGNLEKMATSIRTTDSSMKTTGNIKIFDSLTGTYKGLIFNAGSPQVCSQDYLMALGEGDIAGHTQMIKIGSNPDIDATDEDIWELGGTYVWPVAKQQMEVISTSAQDSNISAATGIKRIIIWYLDSTFTEKIDTVNMNGTVAVTTNATDIYRINFVEAYTTGTGLAAAGNIDIRNTDHTTIYARISTGYTRSRQWIYTVPKDKTLYIYSVDLSAICAGTNGCRFTTRSRYSSLGNSLRSFFLPNSELGVQNGAFSIELKIPTKFISGVDLKMSAIGTSASANIVATCAVRGWLE